jgi:MscS family membrane protein
MRVLFAVLLALLAALPGWAAEPSWTGQWETRWRDGGARMELQQRGNQVTGSYPAYGGKIEGTVQGRELQGRWIEGPRTGQITFVLAPDGESFMGCFETGEWWTGGRMQAETQRGAIDQAGVRQALRTFVMAGNAARSGNPNEWASAAVVMEFGDAGASMAPGQKLAAAYMNDAMDHIGQVVPQEIPDDPQNRLPYTVFSHPAGAMVIAPTRATGNDAAGWRFNADTVHSARELYTAIEDMPEVESGALPDVPSTYMRIRRWVRGISPALFARIGPLEAWQGVGVLALLAASFAAAFAAGWFVLTILRRAVGGRQAAAEHEFRWPLRLALAFLLYHFVIPVLGLPEDAKRVSTGATDVILALAVMWGGWKLIDTFGASASKRAQATMGNLDEIVVSLVMGTLKLTLLAGGLLFIAQALSLPYEGVLAGLGIGGLAVAFASKETLSNVFGAGILVADRPFRRGDWIEAGEAKGTVENVGIRSTRIRTGDDSLLVVPNGKLADATVNNLGNRRHRVLNTKLLVAHPISPSVLAAFLDGLVATAAAVPDVRPGSAKAGMAAIGPEGVQVELTCCLDVRTTNDERTDRTALMLDVLRLAERMHVRLGGQNPVAAPALEAVAA